MKCVRGRVRSGIVSPTTGRRNRHLVILAAVALMAVALPAHANPIPPGPWGIGLLFLFIVGLALFVEYLCVRRLLRPWAKNYGLLPCFVVINLVSFPLTIISSILIVAYSLTAPFAILAEIVPIAIEPPMYRWHLRNVGIEIPNLWPRIIVANLLSFALGLVLGLGIEIGT